MYSPEDAQKWEEANSAYHSATVGHAPDGSKPPATNPADRKALVAAARERLEKAQAKLDSARFAEDQLGTWLIAGGLAATVVFGIGYGATRGNGDER